MDSWKAAPGLLALRSSSSGGAGSHQTAAPNSISGFFWTLIPGLLIAVAMLTAFLLLRVKVKRIYVPRTYLDAFPENEKSPRLSDSKFGWVKEFMGMRDEYVLNHHSLDAYLLLRFWRLIILITAVGWPLTWAVLMPVYATSHGGQQQFNRISFSNINAAVDGNRLYAPLFVAWIFLGGIMFLIGRESLFRIQLKQAFSELPFIASRMAARTVLFTNVPDQYLDESALRKALPGVRHVWLATDAKKLQVLVKDRDKTAMKLEGSEVKLCKNANEMVRKARKKNQTNADVENPMKWVDEKKRSKHRLKFLVGQKVDTIDWCRSHLAEVIPKVEKEQELHWTGKAKYNGAVFVEFATVPAAQLAFFNTQKKLPKGFDAREVGARPQEIIWSNLGMSKVQRMIRNAIAIAIIIVLIIFWLPIIAFIGSLSNINSLTNKVKFLSFINKIPGSVLGAVTGLLPTILLAVALILVPIIMKILFKLAGAATVAEVERKVQTWYFVFQFIQIFLVTTISSAAASTVTTILQTPSQAPTLLASNLPKASNFYINYFVLYGLAGSAKQFLNIGGVVIFLLLGKFLDNTPRKMYKRFTTIPGVGWGSFYPVFSLLAVIAITYSCIAPLMMAFSAISLFLLYLAFRYQMLYTKDTTPINTQGEAFSQAVHHLTTGVYLSGICLIGLFAIATAKSTKAAVPLALMIAFLVVMAVYHFILNRALAVMEKHVPEDAELMQTPSHSNNGTEMTHLNNNGNVQSTAGAGGEPTKNPGSKMAAMFIKLLRPPPLPYFAPYLSKPVPEYNTDIRRSAYINPAISGPIPLLWIAKDEYGISTREKELTGKVIGCTDDGAWFDHDTGKLKAVWVSGEKNADKNMATDVPLYQDLVLY